MILQASLFANTDTIFTGFFQFLKLIFYGFLPALIFAILWIKLMKKKEFGQFIREDGPESHLKKQGIPTMGGISFILASILMYYIVSPFRDVFTLYIIISMLLFALVGFYDDFKKLKKKQNEGLTVKGKAICIVIISIILYVLFFIKYFSIRIPFTDTIISNHIISFIFFVLLYSAVTNASNFTDGLDGLLTIVTLPIAFLFSFIAESQGVYPLVIFNLIFAGALIAYYVLNKYPAMIFMGDLGSLAIGAYVVTNSIILDIYWFIPLFAIWYVIEVVSVIIQVLYFKKTGGKRFFKMAPYHHHLEKKGYSEKAIDKIAFGLTFIASIITLLLYNHI